MNKLKESLEKLTLFFEKHDIYVDIRQESDNHEQVSFSFPRESEYVELSEEEIVKLANEIDSLKVDLSYARTNSIIQFPFLDNDLEDYDYSKLVYKGDDYIIHIVRLPILIGITNVKLGLYSKFAGPLTTYNAIEIYSINNNTIDLEVAKGLVSSFVFEFYQATEKLIEIVPLHDFASDYYYETEDEVEQHISAEVSHLISYNDALEIYLQAIKADDDEIRFLYYYKVIEHFSQKIAKMKTYELLTKKIDSIRYKKLTDDDLNQVITISESLRKFKSDGELAKTVLSECIDIIDLFKYLPVKVRAAICKEAKVNPDTIVYGLSKDSIDSLISQVGTRLYSTRNNIVHAKANYRPDNYQCDASELDQMNVFLSKVAFQILKWNDQLSI